MIFSLVWFYFFLVLFLGMVFIVPKVKIKELLPFGIVGGFILAFIIQYLAVNVFDFWEFTSGAVVWNNIPMGVLISWVPPTILFGYLYYQMKFKLGLIVGFALGTTLVEYGFIVAGYREYLNWNPYLTFLLALGTHLGLAAYLKYKEDAKVGL
jgi:hypothetical protein